MKNFGFWKRLRHAWKNGDIIDIEIEIPFETVVFVLVALIVISLWLLLR